MSFSGRVRLNPPIKNEKLNRRGSLSELSVERRNFVNLSVGVGLGGGGGPNGLLRIHV